ncbi:MAG TPA: TolC family protein [Chitinophagales bacterium]|nr:TolC family protein [Chitinophagales bacterium]
MFRIFKSVSIVLCAFFVFTLSTNAQQADSLSDTLRLGLSDAISQALQKNLTRQNNDLDVLYARKQVNILTANGLPQVNANVNYQRFLQLPISLVPAEFFGGTPGEFAEIAFGTNNTIAVNAQASQLLFSGSFFIALQAAKKLVEQAELQIEATENQIRDAIARTYFSALIIQENGVILQKNINVLAQVLTETEAFYKAGFVENLDVDRLQLQLSNLKTQQTALKRQLESVYNLLKLQLVMDLNQPIALTQNLRDFIDPNDLTRQIDTIAFNNRIELKQLNMSDNLNELGIKQLYATRLPTVSAFLSYERRFQSNDFDVFSDKWFPTAVTGLQVSVPIFDGLSRKNQIAQRFINKKKIQNGRTQLLNSFDLEVAQARIAYQNALEQLKSQEANIALAQKIYNVSLTKYKEGVGSSLELTDAESKLFQNQGLYSQALYNLLLAQTDLRKAMGLYY